MGALGLAKIAAGAACEFARLAVIILLFAVAVKMVGLLALAEGS